MSWFKQYLNKRFTSIAQIDPTQIDSEEIVKYIMSGLYLEGYNEAGGFVFMRQGQIVPTSQVAEIIARAAVDANDPNFMQRLIHDAAADKPAMFDINFDGNQIQLLYNGMSAIPGHLFEGAIRAQGIEPHTLGGTHEERSPFGGTMQNASEGDYLDYANKVGYVLANSRVELDHPRYQGEKYDTSYHFTIFIRGNASRQRLLQELPFLQPFAESLSRGAEKEGLRVTQRAGVAALLDYLNLDLQVPLRRLPPGAESENFRLAEFQDSALQALVRMKPDGVDENDIREYFTLGFEGELI